MSDQERITLLAPWESYPPTPGLAPPPRPLPRVETFRARSASGEWGTWSARTEGGEWGMERLEEPGTPWELIHMESGKVVARCGSLNACRRRILEIEDEGGVKP